MDPILFSPYYEIIPNTYNLAWCISTICYLSREAGIGNHARATGSNLCFIRAVGYEELIFRRDTLDSVTKAFFYTTRISKTPKTIERITFIIVHGKKSIGKYYVPYSYSIKKNNFIIIYILLISDNHL